MLFVTFPKAACNSKTHFQTYYRYQSIILNFEQPNGYFLISFMMLTCCEKKLKRLENVSVSAYQSLVSVSSRAEIQTSQSRLGLGEMWEGLGLGLVSD